MNKNLGISFDEYGFVEIAEQEGQVTFTVTDFEEDEENSKTFTSTYKQKNQVSIYIDTDDLKQIRDAINYILESSEEEC